MEGLYSLLVKVAFNCGRDREPLKALRCKRETVLTGV